MTASKSPGYTPEYPERFNWSLLDSPRAQAIAEDFASRIRGESLLIPSQRHVTAGLRHALRMIAETFDTI